MPPEDKTVINADSGEQVDKAIEGMEDYSDAAAQARANINQLGVAQSEAAEHASALGSVISGVGSMMGRISQPITNLLQGMNGLTEATQKQSSVFGLGATYLIGYTDRVSGVAKAMNINPVNGYMEQFKSLANVINDNSSALSAKQSALAQLKEILNSTGAPLNEINNAFASGVPHILNYAKNVLSSADSLFTMRDSQLAMAASTGNMSEFWEAAGADLDTLNNSLAAHQTVLDNVALRTGAAPESIREWYGQLAKIPGAMQQMVRDTNSAGQETEFFSALLLQAQANGRNFNTVIQEASDLFVNYGITGDNALTVIGRISEVSEKSKIPIDALKSSLMSTANNFAGLANAGEASGKQFNALANNINNYYQALLKTGMSSSGALASINQMTSAVSNLSIAQKSFLSQQTGGPGGLMGGFQIQKMLMEGDTAGVFEKARETLMKQMGGNIVGIDEASQSQSAANQLQRQIMMLQQGPLSQFAKTENDAIRLLEALKNNDVGAISPQLSETVVQDQINRGDMLREQTRTPLTDWQAMFNAMTFKVDFANADTIQRTLSQRPGTTRIDTESSKQMRDNLATPTSRFNIPGSTGESVAQLAPLTAQLAQQLFPNLQGAASGLIANISNPDTINANTTAAQQLANAPRANTNTEQNNNQNNQNQNNASQSSLPNTEHTIRVKIDGLCTDCGQKTHSSEHLHAVSPQAANANRKR